MVHVAVHVRRGDLFERGFHRWISNAKLNRAMVDLVAALSEVREVWASAHSAAGGGAHMHRAAGGGGGGGGSSGVSGFRPLAISVHVMSQSDNSGTSKLPRDAWAALTASSNLTFHTHIDSDPFETMHHLIAADVLLKSNSGFSDVAAAYAAGLKLYFVSSKETFFGAVGPLEPGSGLRDPAMRSKFVCGLISHLRYKEAHPLAV